MNKNPLFILSCILQSWAETAGSFCEITSASPPAAAVRLKLAFSSVMEFKVTMVGDILPISTEEVIPCDSAASILARQYFAETVLCQEW